MADALGPHTCPVCFKTYKRREHLQRHRSSHTSERPHRCGLCGAAFQRSDVLKRHLQTCDGPSAQSSSRRRACDRCVRQKKACNAAQPCLNCEKRSLECHYSTPNQSTSLSQPGAPPAGASEDHTAPPPSFDDTQQGPSDAGLIDSTFDRVPFDDLDILIQQAVSQFPPWESQPPADPWPDHANFSQLSATAAPGIEPFHHEPARSSASSRYRKYSFRFLSDFTSRTGLVSSFECATPGQRQQIVAAFHQSCLAQQPPDFLPAVPSLSVPADAVDLRDLELSQIVVFPETDVPSWSPWLHDPIVVKLQQIVMLIKTVVTVKPNNSSVTLTWSTDLEQSCRQFFAPLRFSKFIELYWSIWHPNVNMLHRPTFDPASTKSILLACMVLIGDHPRSSASATQALLTPLGACVSPDTVDNENAKMWFNCIEEVVFTDDDFCRDVDPLAGSDITLPMNNLANRRKLQALQAAWLICIIQNWEGTDASKRRVRRHRFSTVVSVGFFNRRPALGITDWQPDGEGLGY
jgi:hypothetical protein